MAWMPIDFPFTASANPFTPGRFVIKWCTWSSGTCDKLCSSFRSSFWGQTFPESFHVTSLKVLFTMRGCTWPWEFTKLLLNWGGSRSSVTDNSRTWLHQGCACQLGVIRITSTSTILDLLIGSIKRGKSIQ